MSFDEVSYSSQAPRLGIIVDENSDKQLLIISMVENVENKGGSSYVVNKVKTLFEKIQ